MIDSTNAEDARTDPEIRRLLEEVEAPGPAQEVDWVGLRARIMDRARLPLARLRRSGRWWEHAARWAPPAIPAAIAAGIALLLLTGMPAAPVDPSPGAADGPRTFAELLGTADTGPELELILAEDDGGETLLRAALDLR